MTAITLEQLETERDRFADLIEQFKKQSVDNGVILDIEGMTIDLGPGERYAGVVLNDNGTVRHHLVLMAPRPEKRLDWKAALAWAADVDGELPTRREQALLFANCKSSFENAWYWSSEPEGSSYAWRCYFGSGGQYSTDQSYEGLAVAVRRLVP